VTMRKMRRDGIVPPFATPESVADPHHKHKLKADPADGFLASLTEIP
jgi:hypothetical protein